MNDMVGHIRSNLYMTIYDIFQGLLPNRLPNPSLIYLFILIYKISLNPLISLRVLGFYVGKSYNFLYFGDFRRFRKLKLLLIPSTHKK